MCVRRMREMTSLAADSRRSQAALGLVSSHSVALMVLSHQS